MRPARLAVGRIVAVHGLRGEVLVEPLSEREERFSEGAILQIEGERGALAPIVVEAGRHHKRRLLVKFRGVGDRASADLLRGRYLYAEAREAGEGRFYHHELVGLEVRTVTGRRVGLVTGIQSAPAQDLLVVAGERGEILIPMVDRFVVEIDPARGIVSIDPVPGLVDP